MARLMEQIKPLVCQTVQASKEQAKAFIVSELDWRLFVVDARVNIFEPRVQKSLEGAQPVHMAFVQ